MPPAYRLAPFDAAHPAPAAALARLQADLLPTSPLSLLGPRFLERVYYALLPTADLIFGAVAYVDERPVGFIVATADAAGFMGAAIRRWWWRLGAVLATSIVLDPARLAAVWEAVRIMRGFGPAPGGDPGGEMLTFGVLPEYLAPRFVRETGLRLSADLFDCAQEQVAARGVRVVRAIVDADNLPAKFFYKNRGWVLDRTGVPGWRTETVEFIWRA